MLLEPMLARLAGARTVEDTLRVGLRDFVALHGAEMGDLQLLDKRGHLLIVEAWGLTHAFLQTFEAVDVDSNSVCGRAARLRKPVFVRDVAKDKDFAPYAKFAASVPFQAVLSCPLITTGGELIGIMSALSANNFQPTSLELFSAENYARQLADAIADRSPPDRDAFTHQRAAEVMRATATAAS